MTTAKVSEWKRVRLGDVCRVVPGFAFKSQDWRDEGIPVIKIKNIQSNLTVNCEDVDHVPTDVVTPKLAKYELHDGDILIAMTGATAGKVGKLRTSNRMLLNQRVARIAPVDADAGFIWSVVSSDSYQERFFRLADGAAQPNMSGSQIESVELSLPSLATQRKIASVLGAYDELIENNRRRIEILEEMARRLYREWFVHFRFPGHTHVPLTDSPLGKIPKGWLGAFPDHVDFKEGPGLRNWQYRESGLPFLNIRTLVNNDIDLTKVQFLDPKDVAEKYQHFLLEPLDHVISSSGTLGRLVTIQQRHLPLMLNTSIIRMRPKSNAVGRWMLKHFLLSDYFTNQVNAVATGVAQKNYGPSHLLRMSIIAPPPELAAKYESLVAPKEELISSLVNRNANLQTTRDLLLPRLISGELDVSELPIEVEEAARDGE